MIDIIFSLATSFWITAMVAVMMLGGSAAMGRFTMIGTTITICTWLGTVVYVKVRNNRKRDHETLRQQSFSFWPQDIPIEQPKEPLKGFDSWETRRYKTR